MEIFFFLFPQLGIQNPSGQLGEDRQDRGGDGDSGLLHPGVVHAGVDVPAGEAVLRPDADARCRPEQGADAGGDATGKCFLG